MFEITSILGSTFTVTSLLIVIGVSLLLGLALSFVNIFVNRKSGVSRGLLVTLVTLPVVIGVIIMLVQDNWGRAFSLAGAFSIIRFRNTQENPKDLALIFTALGVGLASGTGYILVGVILVAVISCVLIVLDLVRFGEPRSPKMRLKITIPESLNYVGVFDEVFDKYTTSSNLIKVKSTNFGTMFDLTFDIIFKKDVNEKEFIDDLRTTNGNLSISLQNYVANPELTE